MYECTEPPPIQAHVILHLPLTKGFGGLGCRSLRELKMANCRMKHVRVRVCVLVEICVCPLP